MSNTLTTPTGNPAIASVNRTLRVAMAVDRAANNRRINYSDAENRTSSTNQADSPVNKRSYRHSSWHQGPGIRVSLHAREIEPGMDAYRTLRSDGRRKVNTPPRENMSQITPPGPTGSYTDQADRAGTHRRGPQSGVVLKNFIQQMMGIDTPPVPGANINISV